MSMNIPRPEYPRPQFVRESWVNLNGEWDFEIDNAENGESLKFFEREALNGKITVPYCPESKLSGVPSQIKLCFDNIKPITVIAVPAIRTIGSAVCTVRCTFS